VSGVVIVVTVSANNSDGTASASNLALRFFCTRNDTVFLPEKTFHSSTFVTGDGQQIALFPGNDAKVYYNSAQVLNEGTGL